MLKYQKRGKFMVKYEEIEEKIKEKLNITENDENATLASLGLDSLDVVEVILDLEDSYGIKFEPQETQELKNLGDLLRLVKSKLK